MSSKNFTITKYCPELISVGFGQLIHQSSLEYPSLSYLNLHLNKWKECVCWCKG